MAFVEGQFNICCKGRGVWWVCYRHTKKIVLKHITCLCLHKDNLSHALCYKSHSFQFIIS